MRRNTRTDAESRGNSDGTKVSSRRSNLRTPDVSGACRESAPGLDTRHREAQDDDAQSIGHADLQLAQTFPAGRNSGTVRRGLQGFSYTAAGWRRDAGTAVGRWHACAQRWFFGRWLVRRRLFGWWSVRRWLVRRWFFGRWFVRWRLFRRWFVGRFFGRLVRWFFGRIVRGIVGWLFRWIFR